MKFLFSAFALAALAGATTAAETSEVPDKKLSDFKIGEIISGDKVDMKSLEGKVVALEFWGRNCAPCLASMPHLATLDRRYGKKGLQLVGIHSQDGTDEEILKAVKATKVKFPIARNGSSAVKFSGIPHMFVFSTKGELVFHGHPADGEADKAIKKELRDVSLTDDDEEKDDTPVSDPDGPLVAERSWTSTDGRTMVATLVSVEGETGKFKRSGGASFTLPLSRLAAADRQVIEEAQSKSTEKEPAEAEGTDKSEKPDKSEKSEKGKRESKTRN